MCAAHTVQTLTNCGDAIRLEMVYIESQDGAIQDRRACLDNTVWFDRITNARYGEGALVVVGGWGVGGVGGGGS